MDKLKWVVNNLDSDQLAEYDGLVSLGDFLSGVMDWVSEAVDNGFTVSIKFDDYSGCPQATLISKNKDRADYLYAVSARGDDVNDALGLVMFKFERVCLGDLSTAPERPKGRRG